MSFTTTKVDFTSRRFVADEIKLSPELTILGRDLPEFTAWARRNGVSKVRLIADTDEYLAGRHGVVAHDFGKPIAIGEIGELAAPVRSLLSQAERLILFVDVLDSCTVEGMRRAVRLEFPELTSRIIFPRGLYKTSGAKIIMLQRRQPRVFLFMSERRMAGKTESALSFAEASNVTLVHGDEYYFGIITGEIAAPEHLCQAIHRIKGPPFDDSLFAEFVALIPAFKDGKDVVFDLALNADVHWHVMEFFRQRGFFPVLCLTSADRQDGMAEAYHAISHSMSWKLTAPLRLVGRRLPVVARSGRRILDWLTRRRRSVG